MSNTTSVQKNVLGQPLESCCYDPMTGFFRDGYCHTHQQDLGSHTVCARITKEFLDFSLSRGNDLITPNPESGFPGLTAGDFWCVCANRWLEAYQHQKAPPIRLQSTHAAALKTIPLELLKKHSIDLN